jgi:esterase/lipase superfamily enzyme
MLIITNRNIIKSNFKNGIGDEGAFGDEVNSKGPNEVRLAYANHTRGKWQVKLVDEPRQINEDNIPSRNEFDKLKKNLVKDKKNCVFFIHGFNQSFKKNLKKCLELERQHKVEVVAFSWPSNPGGFVKKEYRNAKRTAKASVGALDSTLEKLGNYLKAPFNKAELEKCNVKFSLLVYSLGDFLFQNYVNDAQYEDETRIFDNVILCQADVDNEGHANWVDTIEAGKRIYITINENDQVLKWSDANFQKDRLGRTARNLDSNKATYFDFTDGPNVGSTHGLFYKKTNPVIKNFFSTTLNGGRGELVKGLKYDSRINAFRF